MNGHHRVARCGLVVPCGVDRVRVDRNEARPLRNQHLFERPRPVDDVQPRIVTDLLPRADVRATPFGNARLRPAYIVAQRSVDMVPHLKRVKTESACCRKEWVSTCKVRGTSGKIKKK